LQDDSSTFKPFDLGEFQPQKGKSEDSSEFVEKDLVGKNPSFRQVAAAQVSDTNMVDAKKNKDLSKLFQKFSEQELMDESDKALKP